MYGVIYFIGITRINMFSKTYLKVSYTIFCKLIVIDAFYEFDKTGIMHFVSLIFIECQALVF